MMNKNTLLAVSACALFTMAPAALAETYRDDARHFSFEIPEGWRRMTQEEVDAVNGAAAAISKTPVKVLFVGGMRPVGKTDGFPYVLLQDHGGATKGLSYQALEKGLGAALQADLATAEKALADSGIKMQPPGVPVIDRNKAMFSVVMQGGMEDAMFKAFSCGHLGRDRQLMIQSYETPENFESTLPVFRKLNDSFKFDAGHEFQEQENDSRSLLLGALVGGGVAGAVVLMRARKNKGKPALAEKK